MKKLIYLFWTVASLIVTLVSQTNATNKEHFLEIKGMVKEVKENKNLTGVMIVILDEHKKKVGVHYSDESGKCSFKLPIYRKFVMNISKKGYVTKIVHLNTWMPINKKQSDPFLFDVCLFEKVNGIDVSILKKPIANVTYADYMNCFFYNYTYTDMVNGKLKKAYAEYYRLHSNPDSSKYMQNKEVVYGEDINSVRAQIIPVRNDSIMKLTANTYKKNEMSFTKLFVPEIVLKIQIISVKDPIPLSSPIFNGCGKVEEYLLDDTYKYTSGEYYRLQDAQDLLTKIISITGYDDAYIVAFVGKKRISVGEALRIQKFSLGGL